MKKHDITRVYVSSIVRPAWLLSIQWNVFQRTRRNNGRIHLVVEINVVYVGTKIRNNTVVREKTMCISCCRVQTNVVAI